MDSYHYRKENPSLYMKENNKNKIILKLYKQCLLHTPYLAYRVFKFVNRGGKSDLLQVLVNRLWNENIKNHVSTFKKFYVSKSYIFNPCRLYNLSSNLKNNYTSTLLL